MAPRTQRLAQEALIELLDVRVRVRGSKRVVAVAQMFRAPNGKADYARAREYALAVIAGDGPRA